MDARRFARGSGSYECGICGRQTRATGRGDNEHAKLCAECYDLAGIDNAIADNGNASQWADEVRGLVASLQAKGADVSEWSELVAAVA